MRYCRISSVCYMFWPGKTKNIKQHRHAPGKPPSLRTIAPTQVNGFFFLRNRFSTMFLFLSVYQMETIKAFVEENIDKANN